VLNMLKSMAYSIALVVHSGLPTWMSLVKEIIHHMASYKIFLYGKMKNSLF
jgi:hypothetical protein